MLFIHICVLSVKSKPQEAVVSIYLTNKGSLNLASLPIREHLHTPILHFKASKSIDVRMGDWIFSVWKAVAWVPLSHSLSPHNCPSVHNNKAVKILFFSKLKSVIEKINTSILVCVHNFRNVSELRDTWNNHVSSFI